MRDIIWVKWPSDKATSSRWKRLIRRDDEYEITHRTRLCSRHFDRDCVNKYTGVASEDPKYFAWNNWGQSVKPRKTPAVRATPDPSPPPAITLQQTTPISVVKQSPPEIGCEVEIREDPVHMEISGK